MKSNVDLTLNQDFKSINLDVSYKFSKEKNNHNNLKDLFNSMFKKRYPWSNKNVLKSTLNYKQLFLTGNKKEREEKRQAIRYEKGLDCECCGKDLSKKPWSNYWGLCSKCDKSLEEECTNNKSFWIRLIKNK